MDFRTTFLEKLRRIVASYCKAACSDIEQQWSTLNIEGNASIYDAELNIAKDTVARSIVALGQKAWIAEYGRGSLMESSGIENPFLEDYVNGSLKDEDGNPLFNRERLGHAFAIVGRKHGYYYDLDGVRHHSHGTLAGKVLEGNPAHKYDPIPPRKVIKHVLFGSDDNGLLNEMCKEIQEMTAELVLMFIAENIPKEITLYDDE